MAYSLLSLLIWFPIACGVGLYFFGLISRHYQWSNIFLKLFAIVASILTALGTLIVVAEMDSQNGNPQFGELYSWIPALGVSYALSIHGISAVYAVSVTSLMVLLIVWSRFRDSVALSSLLCTEGAMLGVLFSRDLVLFYLFWELMLIPVFLLMIFYGHEGRRYAAYKFLLYTASCAVFIVSGLLYLSIISVRQTERYSFLISDLIKLNLPAETQIFLGVGFLIAFMVKVPVFPLHSWFRDAQCESPFEGAVLFTTMLFQMGIFGLVTLVFPLFPLAGETLSPLLAILGVVSMLYGALLAFREGTLRALVAYSSISHLGLCVFGIACFSAVTLSGAVFHSIAHALSAAAVMFVLGSLERRNGIVKRSDAGGLASRAPIVALVFFILLAGYMALPLTNGFIGELVILVGGFSIFPFLTTVVLLGIIFGTVYTIQMFGDIFFGKGESVQGEKRNISIEFTWREWCALFPLLVLTFSLGIFPTPLFKTIEAASKELVTGFEERREAGRGRQLQYEMDLRNRNGGVQSSTFQLNPVEFLWNQ